MNKKIAIIISHPIQHWCPQYVSLSKNENISCKVFFASKLGLVKYRDNNFNEDILWNNLNIDKFEHEFLNDEKVLQANKNLDAPLLEEALNLFNPDILITYGYFQKYQRRAYKWAIRNNVILVYISDSELRQHRPIWKTILKTFYLKLYFSKINYFFTIGNSNEHFYFKHGVKVEKLIRMHYPIDIQLFSEAQKIKNQLKIEIRKKYEIKTNDFVLAVVGKLVEWKNQDHIIDAMLLLEKQGYFMHLFVIGSGEQMLKWKCKAALLKKSKVHFTGFINADELPAFYAATDIYIHPASIEPHSVAVSEAIAMGCPIIVSNRCGSYGETDDVQIGRNGYVYTFGNIAELAEKIKLLINDTGILESFGNNSQHISEQFQHRSHFGSIMELLERISENN